MPHPLCPPRATDSMASDLSPAILNYLRRRANSLVPMPLKSIKSQQALPRHPTPATYGAPTAPPSTTQRHYTLTQPMPHTMENISMTYGTPMPTIACFDGTRPPAKWKSMHSGTSFLMKNWDLIVEPPSGTKHTTVSYPESKPSKLKTTTAAPPSHGLLKLPEP